MTPTRETGLLLLSLGLTLASSTTGAEAQDRSRGLEPVQMASATPFGVERGLGSPVVFSRTDVESPLARIRTWNSDPGSTTLGLETAGNAAPDVSPLADPAFKSVLLTPRSSTGRPVQPTYEPPPEMPAEAPAPPRKEASLPPQQLKPLPQMRHESTAPALSNPKPRNERSVKPTVVRPAGPKGGPAEIAATRAFTRW